jgi:hypothetical protein
MYKPKALAALQLQGHPPLKSLPKVHRMQRLLPRSFYSSHAPAHPNNAACDNAVTDCSCMSRPLHNVQVTTRCTHLHDGKQLSLTNAAGSTKPGVAPHHRKAAAS